MSYSNAISSTQPIQTPITTSATKAETSTAASTDQGAAKGSIAEGDRTSLSTSSTHLVAALTTSDVRADKVASLQQAIASGSYNVSSSAIADKLLTSLLKA